MWGARPPSTIKREGNIEKFPKGFISARNEVEGNRQFRVTLCDLEGRLCEQGIPPTFRCFDNCRNVKIWLDKDMSSAVHRPAWMKSDIEDHGSVGC
jgi:hypothetical protein